MENDAGPDTVADWIDDRFRDFLDLSPDALVIADGTGRIVAANIQMEDLFGYPLSEIIGNSVDMLVPDAVRPRHTGLREAYFRSPHKRPMGSGLDLFGRRKDGSEVPVEISLGPIRTPHGMFVLSAIRDISVRKRIEQELQRLNLELERRVEERTSELARSNADLQQFAYVASHDLQEPLRMVASYTQLLARRYRGRLDADADDFINFAVQGANRMQRLINDLLAYSRVGTKGRPFEAVGLNALFDQVTADLQVAIEEAGAEVTRDDLPTVSGDHVQLGQVLQNLLVNAIKFRSAESPRVHVGVEDQDPEWLFRVEDNGLGIAPEFADRIFVIFQRLHGPDQYLGSGIGLAICKKIVERHGGRIWVTPGTAKGSVFWFTLPKG